MFTTNTTVADLVASPGAIDAEFVTSGYFGGCGTAMLLCCL